MGFFQRGSKYGALRHDRPRAHPHHLHRPRVVRRAVPLRRSASAVSSLQATTSSSRATYISMSSPSSSGLCAEEILRGGSNQHARARRRRSALSKLTRHPFLVYTQNKMQRLPIMSCPSAEALLGGRNSSRTAETPGRFSTTKRTFLSDTATIRTMARTAPVPSATLNPS